MNETVSDRVDFRMQVPVIFRKHRKTAENSSCDISHKQVMKERCSSAVFRPLSCCKQITTSTLPPPPRPITPKTRLSRRVSRGTFSQPSGKGHRQPINHYQNNKNRIQETEG